MSISTNKATSKASSVYKGSGKFQFSKTEDVFKIMALLQPNATEKSGYPISTHISKGLVGSLDFCPHEGLIMNPNIYAGIMSEKPSRKLEHSLHWTAVRTCPSPVSIKTNWVAWTFYQSPSW